MDEAELLVYMIPLEGQPGDGTCGVSALEKEKHNGGETPFV